MADPRVDEKAQATKSQVRSWLQEEGWRVEDRPASELAWRLGATDHGGRTIVVWQKPAGHDQVVIQAAINVSPHHQKQIGLLPQHDRENFLWDMRFRLAEMGLLFQGITDPPQQIILTQRIYYDGLSKDAFLQRTTQVVSGLFLVLGMVARKFSEPGPAEPQIH